MLKGKCLCGCVSIEVEGALERQPVACHCTQCRKQTGHFLVALAVPREALTVSGNENISWYRSSEEAQRGFCSVCGSTLFWKSSADEHESISVAMGLFELPTDTRIEKHIFIDDKGDYYNIDE